jgi:hypothetical protein
MTSRKAPAAPPKSVLGSIPYDKAELNAMYALSTGAATDEQQLRAWSWIIGALCRYHDVSYRPGADGDRDTAFAEGRRFVAAEMIKMTRVNPAILEDQDA